MAKLKVTHGEQKAFVRIFDSICQWNSPWERWNDMVMMFAIEIANVTDTVHREAREKTYKAIVAKYKPQEMQGFEELFCELVNNLQQNPYQDFLGQMYMELGFGNSGAGQFFTPYSLCQAMAITQLQTDEIRQRLADKGWIAINDPACGAGATLIAAAEILHRDGFDYQRTALFVGQDLDQTVALMCYIQLSLIGCAGYVHIANTLTEPLTGDVLLPNGTANTWYMPMYFTSVWGGRVIARRLDMFINSLRKREPIAEPMEAEPPAEVPERAEEHAQPLQLSFFS